jgi:hypothetical protein
MQRASNESPSGLLSNQAMSDDRASIIIALAYSYPRPIRSANAPILLDMLDPDQTDV